MVNKYGHLKNGEWTLEFEHKWSEYWNGLSSSSDIVIPNLGQLASFGPITTSLGDKFAIFPIEELTNGVSTIGVSINKKMIDINGRSER